MICVQIALLWIRRIKILLSFCWCRPGCLWVYWRRAILIAIVLWDYYDIIARRSSFYLLQFFSYSDIPPFWKSACFSVLVFSYPLGTLTLHLNLDRYIVSIVILEKDKVAQTYRALRPRAISGLYNKRRDATQSCPGHNEHYRVVQKHGHEDITVIVNASTLLTEKRTGAWVLTH
jgi:hypothetical protein